MVLELSVIIYKKQKTIASIMFCFSKDRTNYCFSFIPSSLSS